MDSMAAPLINYSMYPLRDVEHPHQHDVLCGRGGGTNAHTGNLHWRMLVAANKQLYITLPKKQKMLLSRSIVNAVRSQNPPGRFLQKDSKSNKWFDVGDQRAQEKTSQALREGAPDIRKKVAASHEEGSTEEAGTDRGENNISGESSDEEDAAAQTTGLEEKNDDLPNSNNNLPNSTKENAKASTTTEAAKESTPTSKNCRSNDASSVDVPPKNGAAVAGGMTPFMGDHIHHPSNRIGYGNLPPHYAPLASSQQQAMMAQFVAATANQSVTGSNSHGGVSMQLYPTMVLNEQGVLVPGMSVFPNPGMAMSHIPPPRNMAESAATHATSNTLTHHQQQQLHIQHQMQQLYQRQHRQPQVIEFNDFEPLPIDQNTHGQPSNSSSSIGREDSVSNYNRHSNYYQHHQQQMNYNDNMKMVMNSTTATPTFDDFVAAPDGLDTGGLSYGSMAMTDAEMGRLQASVGSSTFHHRQTAMRTPSQNGNTNYRQQFDQDNDAAFSAPGGLEPTGISFGDVSMMSVGTNNMKLDETGTSFGTMMSFNTTHPAAVDGGLEAIGASFGSLSLDMSNRDSLFRSLELAAAGPEIPPMFPSEAKSHGNLLECSDTESENSDDKEELVKQKSEAWERMKSQIVTATSLRPEVSKGSIASQELMPPPSDVSKVQPMPHMVSCAVSEGHRPMGAAHFVNTEVAVPTTTLENNFSTLSTWTAADDFYNDYVGGDEDDGAPPPTQALRKEDSW